MDGIAWPLVTFGAALALVAAIGLAVGARSLRTEAGDERPGWASPVALLVAALVLLAGLLLALWGLNLGGNLGR